MKLCVSCKACRRECPTGVDMARMKIEVLAARAAKHGLSLHDRLVGYLPRYAPYAARLSVAVQPARPSSRGAAALSEAHRRVSARRTLPRWRRTGSRDDSVSRLRARVGRGPPIRRGHGRTRRPATTRSRALRRHLQPLLRAARTSTPRSTCCAPAGYRVHVATPADGTRGRSAAAAPSSPSAASTRRARGRAHARGAGAVRLRAACRWSGSSRAASSALPRRDSGDDQADGRAAELAGHALTVRGIPRARGAGRPARLCRSRRSRTARCCTAIAIRKRSAPCGAVERCSSSCRS